MPALVLAMERGGPQAGHVPAWPDTWTVAHFNRLSPSRPTRGLCPSRPRSPSEGRGLQVLAKAGPPLRSPAPERWRPLCELPLRLPYLLPRTQDAEPQHRESRGRRKAHALTGSGTRTPDPGLDGAAPQVPTHFVKPEDRREPKCALCPHAGPFCPPQPDSGRRMRMSPRPGRGPWDIPLWTLPWPGLCPFGAPGPQAAQLGGPKTGVGEGRAVRPSRTRLSTRSEVRNDLPILLPGPSGAREPPGRVEGGGRWISQSETVRPGEF